MEAKVGQITKDDIEVVRLEPNDAAVDFIHGFFTDVVMQENMADNMANFSFIYGFVDRFLKGEVVCYVPMIDGAPAGMGHFSAISSTIIQGHQGVFPQYRRKYKKIITAGINKVFQDTQCQAIMGFTPVFNKAARKAAENCGFRSTGTIRKSYLYRGILEDVNIMICERGQNASS